MSKIMRNVFVRMAVDQTPSKRGRRLRRSIANQLDLPSTLPVDDDDDEESSLLTNEAEYDDDDNELDLPSTAR